MMSEEGGSSNAILVIYISSRGLLELWQLPYGPRVSAVNIGRGHSLRQCQTECFVLSASGHVVSVQLDVNFRLIYGALSLRNEDRSPIAKHIVGLLKRDPQATMQRIVDAMHCDWTNLPAAMSVFEETALLRDTELDRTIRILKAYASFVAAVNTDDNVIPFADVHRIAFHPRDLLVNAELWTSLARFTFDPTLSGDAEMVGEVGKFLVGLDLPTDISVGLFFDWIWDVDCPTSSDVALIMPRLFDVSNIDPYARRRVRETTATGPAFILAEAFAALLCDQWWTDTVHHLLRVRRLREILSDSSAATERISLQCLESDRLSVSKVVALDLCSRQNHCNDIVREITGSSGRMVADVQDEFPDCGITSDSLLVSCALVIFDLRGSLDDSLSLLGQGQSSRQRSAAATQLWERVGRPALAGYFEVRLRPF